VALLLARELPPGADSQRINAEALQRMGRPGEAAHQLDGLATISDRTRRAELLCEAKVWAEAAAAYAGLLRDPALTADARGDAADRYGLALALSGGNPDRTLPNVKEGLAARVIAALPAQGIIAPSAAGVSLSLGIVERALDRAKQIETLLPAATSNPGA
jgi:hypothetical protein